MPPLLIGTAVHGLGDHLRLSDGGRIERRASPGHIDRKSRKVHNAAVTTVTAQIVRGAHEDAIHRTGLDTQSAKHALGIVDRVTRNAKSLAVFDPLLANVDAIDRTSFGALIGRASCRERV